MSVNYNRAYFNRGVTPQEYIRFRKRWDCPPYWDEGLYLYPKWRRGYKNPNKYIFNGQRRCWRTWKYNRKTQWKN